MNDEGDVDAVLFCYGTFIVFFSGSDYEFAQGVIMNDEGDAVEFSVLLWDIHCFFLR